MQIIAASFRVEHDSNHIPPQQLRDLTSSEPNLKFGSAVNGQYEASIRADMSVHIETPRDEDRRVQ